MIVTRVKKSKNDNTIKSFTISGHAEFAKVAGKPDIVCAAVSAIVYTALGYMEEYYGMQDFDMADGYIKWVRPENITSEVSQKIDPVLDAMVVGIRQVEAKYPKHVNVVIEEV